VAYKNVVVTGIVLDEKGSKMSKSKGNILVPKEVIEKYGVDCVRLYLYTVNQVDQPKKFSLKELQDLHRKFFFTLNNCLEFWQMYAGEEYKKDLDIKSLEHVLDQWIISRLNTLTEKLNKNLDNYDIVGGARLFLDFVDDLSNWYIRRSRKRFQRPSTVKEKENAILVLRHVLLELAKLLAPFTPFISEHLYQALKGKSEKLSVHLSNYPEAKEKEVQPDLEREMAQTKEVTTLALAQRVKAGLKVRQPLALLKVSEKKMRDNQALLDLVKEEVNVKEVRVEKIDSAVDLDTNLTPALKQEGQLRELVRAIQQMKKQAQVKPNDQVVITYQAKGEIKDFLNQHQEWLKQEVKANFSEEKIQGALEKNVKIEDQEIILGLKILK